MFLYETSVYCFGIINISDFVISEDWIYILSGRTGYNCTEIILVRYLTQEVDVRLNCVAQKQLRELVTWPRLTSHSLPRWPLNELLKSTMELKGCH